MTATIIANGITLAWVNPGDATLLLRRRAKGLPAGQWTTLVNESASTLSSFTDNNLVMGQTYEYALQRTTNAIQAFGYAHAAIHANVTDTRGKLLLFVDAALATPLASEIERLQDDLIGDGWELVVFSSESTATVTSTRNQITAAFNAEPTLVKAVFLLGAIPVPYAGNSAWDGHSDHQGAWPSDALYADLSTTGWTDVSVNNTSPNRDANDNIPGDGKFDQSYIPTSVELQVGRVDFRRLSWAAYGAVDEVDLYRRYLNKNHAWRSGQYTVANKALVDDNFGYFGGEAFAANGFRNAYPLVGADNIVETDFFNNTNPQTWLLGYGTGGGSYQSAGGVGSSSNFMTDTVNIVFSNLFGSYHGDWDYEADPFMPAALASRGGILTCSWAGRPHVFNQALASGETIGFCHRETQNAQFNTGYANTFGRSGAHLTLLGDPTVRAHVVKPVEGVNAVATCTNVSLSWSPSTDVDVEGYHIYRAVQKNGVYTRLTSDLISNTSFLDLTAPAGSIFYQIKAVKQVITPGGGIYLNSSTGAIISVMKPAPFVASIAPHGTLTCITTSLPLSPIVDLPIGTYTCAWSTGATADCILLVTDPGSYTVTITANNGCTSSANTVVPSDTESPIVSTSGTLTCSNTCLLLPPTGLGGSPNTWTGPCVSTQGNMVCASCPGLYIGTSINVSNGCAQVINFSVIESITAPGASAGVSGPADCNGTIQLTGNSSTSGVTYAWQGPGIAPANQFLQNPMVSVSGVYILTVTNPLNGCSSTDAITVSIPTGAVVVITTTPTNQGQSNGSVDLQVMGSIPPFTYLWSNGAITQDLTGLESGTYTCTITNANGCTSVAQTMVSELSKTDLPDWVEAFSLAPNPTQSMTNLRIKLPSPMNLDLSLLDMTGRILWSKSFEKQTELNLPFDLSAYPSGYYQYRAVINGVVLLRSVSKI